MATWQERCTAAPSAALTPIYRERLLKDQQQGFLLKGSHNSGRDDPYVRTGAHRGVLLDGGEFGVAGAGLERNLLKDQHQLEGLLQESTVGYRDVVRAARAAVAAAVARHLPAFT